MEIDSLDPEKFIAGIKMRIMVGPLGLEPRTKGL